MLLPRHHLHAILLLSVLFSTPAITAAEPGRGQLNILWLSVEDMSPWIGPYGDMTVPTPNLDRLAREGKIGRAHV